MYIFVILLFSVLTTLTLLYHQRLICLLTTVFKKKTVGVILHLNPEERNKDALPVGFLLL